MRYPLQKLPLDRIVVGGIWVGLLALILCFFFTERCSLLTPDQQGDRWMKRGESIRAAESYQDAQRIGVAYYRAGNFKAAARAFRQGGSAEAQFNRGNALVMQGLYTEAMTAYDNALDVRPSWEAATVNREIARVRAERLKTEGGEMTGGMLGADEIVITAGKKGEGGSEETTEGGEVMGDLEIQALWLQRIQTRPADFLKSKFAYQAQRGEAP